VRRLPALLILALAGCGGGGDGDPPRAARDAEPTVAAPIVPSARGAAAMPPRPPGRWLTARVERRTALRTTPRGRVLARIGRRTEFGAPRWVGVTARRGAWLEVIVPERPNGRTAWIRARAARLHATDLSLHVDLSDRTLVVRRRDRVVRRMPVGIGGPDNPTPTGRFAVTDKLEMGGPGTTYGCCAIALSGHQSRLPPGWPGGDRLAVHGTRFPATIGRAASLGCMRAAEPDLRHMMRSIPLGAPVWIRA
jgi:L,D-transpeptidase catalytic domain